jgi:hypothetical protein
MINRHERGLDSLAELQVSDPSLAQRWPRAWVPALVTVFLGVSAALAINFAFVLATSHQDTEALESPLLLAVVRQLYDGPWGLYGPYSGRNPLVLIHAPLFYHLAALLAWPLSHAGLHPVQAALVAGRSLSIVGLCATLLGAYRIACLDRAPAKSGWWAVCLLVSTPVLNGFAVEVRPDMLGVGLQTVSVLAVLSALHRSNARAAPLGAAFAGFALAFCVKQTYVAALFVSLALLLGAWRRGQIELKRIQRGVMLASLIVLAMFGAEELATGGRLSQAVFVATRGVGRVHPSDWFRVVVIGHALLRWSVGIAAVLAAASAARVAGRTPLFWNAVGVAGALIVALALVLQTLEIVIDSSKLRVLQTLTQLTLVLAVIPICACAEPLPEETRRLERTLWIYLVAELLVATLLSRASTGAWINYAIQAVVFAAILAGRLLARCLAGATRPRWIPAVALAALVPLIGTYKYTSAQLYRRDVERRAVDKIFTTLRAEPSAVFFVDRPGDNRLHGRLDLVYDDWLYQVFESLGLAQPRSVWLRHALRGGTIRYVINTSDDPAIAGLPETLPRMGYVPSIQVGPFYVWKRVARGEAEYGDPAAAEPTDPRRRLKEHPFVITTAHFGFQHSKTMENPPAGIVIVQFLSQGLRSEKHCVMILPSGFLPECEATRRAAF